ncbi:CHAD domain-containing protein [Sinorhizobium meliloti]|uniref:CHAD domain-containing protein n=1 Tax=Rhizobium meliloti TaxID=382 RepID=UPI0002F5BC13|nr:CHAD domain-containing protein [Sinorhizobium meliloti]UFX12400.1 CHAD domain-containing protein [Sinorhizobium meliloti]
MSISDDETRHQLRITAKKLRCAAEFFSPLCMGKAETKRHKRSRRWRDFRINSVA